MAKGQQRGYREAKKPKKENPKVAATAQASIRLNPLKSTGANGDQGKTKLHAATQFGSKNEPSLPDLDEVARRDFSGDRIDHAEPDLRGPGGPGGALARRHRGP